MTYFKPPESRKALSQILGQGMPVRDRAIVELTLSRMFFTGVLVTEGTRSFLRYYHLTHLY